MKKGVIVAVIIIILMIIFGASIILNKSEDSDILNKYDTITPTDLIRELEDLKKINRQPENENINPEDYPVVLGTYSENGLTLIKAYRCSDVCPAYGGVSIIFQNITEERCGKIGGEIKYDPAWGGYKGCSPKIS